MPEPTRHPDRLHPARRWTTRLLAPVLAAAVAVAMSTTEPVHSQNAGGWKQDWNVRCTWLDRELLELTSELLIELFSTMDAEPLAEAIAEFNCDDTRMGLAGFSRKQFRASSRWLESFGFRDPVVKSAPDARKYLAWLDLHIFKRRDDQGQVVLDSQGTVIVDPNGYYFPTGEIYISPPMVRGWFPVEAHEQFHGVQNRSVPTQYPRQTPYSKWIWEGTARAVDQAWSRKPGTPYVPGFEGRYFDRSLYWIPKVPGWKITEPAYATAAFWLDVGRQARSRDWIEYLPDVFARIAGAGKTSDMLQGIDDALKALFVSRGVEGRGGFYRAYPEFVRFALSDPDRAADHFEFVRPVVLSLPNPQNGGPEHVVRMGPPRRADGSCLDQLAADAFIVRVRVPPGRVASLRIEFEQNWEHLHLIVDDRRYDRWTGPHDYDRRNVFGTTISGSDTQRTFYVRVAHVSDPVTSSSGPTRYTLTFTLTSSHALAIAAGSEAVRADDGVLFSYVNVKRDPTEMARSIQAGLIERNADHAGISRDTEAGRATRQEIAGITGSVLGPAPAPLARGAGRTAVTPGARCLATITVFDDESRSVAKMQWSGTAPLLGGTHPIKGVFATGLHDSVYSQMKSMGQELTLLEDPEALARWQAEAERLTLPGVSDLLTTAGHPDEAVKTGNVIGGILRGLPGRRPREGQPAAPRRGQTELGRKYDEGGAGTLEVERGPGDKIVGRFQFSASETGTPRAVNVEGQFIAVPGPLSLDNLWNGCETMVLPPEDNGDIIPDPAIYPPGLETECEHEHSALYCFCFENPVLPGCGWWPGPEPVNCRPGPNSTVTVEKDWHDVGFVNGRWVQKRTLRRQPEILQPALNGGSDAACRPTFFEEERELPPPGGLPEPSDCEPGPVVTTVEEAWHDVGVVDGQRVQRRTLRHTPSIEAPAQNGGSDAACRPWVTEEERKLPPEGSDPVDCEPGDDVIVTVEEDWHEVVVDGRRVRQRKLQLTPTVRVPAQNGGDDFRCRPTFKVEEEEITGGSVAPPEREREEPPSAPPSTSPPPDTPHLSDEGGRRLTLDFLEEDGTNVRSARQDVSGGASVAGVAVQSKEFDLGLVVSDAQMAPCGFNRSVRLGLRMMASGRTLETRLRLDVASGQLQLELQFDQGVILIQGGARLQPIGPTSIRGDVAGATLDLRLDQGNFRCSSLMNFSFVVEQSG